MRSRPATAIGLAIALGVVSPIAALACPAGSIAGAGDLAMTPFGPIIVESCMTEDAGLFTLMYQITNETIREIGICEFYIPGFGVLSTVSADEPPGLTMSVDEASGCATWWIWKGSGAVLLPGETVTLSFTLNTEAAPTRREAHISLCDGTALTAEIIAPSACLDISDARLVGCFCGEESGSCDTTALFEGSGTRIEVLGSERQVLAVCDESWVRHGWAGVERLEDPDFRLEIDGVEVRLERRDHCTPGTTPGLGHLASMWHVQFPAEFFEAGRLYEFTGYWYLYSRDPGERLIYSRTVEVQVLPCLVPVTDPIPELTPMIELPCPDLIPEIADVECTCGWSDQQVYQCELAVYVKVLNVGDATADRFVTSLETSEGIAGHTMTLTELAPGDARSLTLRVVLDEPVSDLEYTVLVDSLDEVTECDEGNNKAAGDASCE
jgi:hypothetical protein